MSESYQDSALARGPSDGRSSYACGTGPSIPPQEAREVQRRGRPVHGAPPEHDRPRVEPERGYRPKQAQRMADRRRLRSQRPAKLEGGPTREYVVSRLRRRWSPDQIAGRMRHDFPRQPRRWLSPQTISNWINSEAPEWEAWLRRGGRPPEKRGRLAGCVRI